MSLGWYEKAEETARFIRGQTSLRPRVGLILGSGLGAFGDSLEEATKIPYDRIPHFPLSTVVGHAGRLVMGRKKKVAVAILQGRAHYYEGYTLEEVVFPVRVLKGLGIGVLVVTNAAGGISRRVRSPGFMLLSDHINLLGENPLRGPNEERWGPRYPDMTEAYSKELRKLARREGRRLKLPLSEGVYAAVPGPCYETPAEVRWLARLGADVVGMSTVPETIVARHMGMKVLGLSSVTNKAAGLSKKEINHEEVLEVGERMAARLAAFLQALLPGLEKAAP